jgi:integral membrane protein (TIGR01906 family)
MITENAFSFSTSKIYMRIKNIGIRFARLLVVVLMPFILLILPARVTMQPWIVPFQYSLPWMPPDQFGFSKDERLQLGNLGLKAVVGVEGVSILKKPRFADGSQVFNDREIQHLADVAVVIRWMWPLHTFLSILFITGIIALWLLNAELTLGKALSLGSKATLFIVGFILLFAVFAWDWAFTKFHQLFFAGDSYLFYIDDTLIRLYPVEFWITCTMMIGAAVVLLALMFWWIGRWLWRRADARLRLSP